MDASAKHVTSGDLFRKLINRRGTKAVVSAQTLKQSSVVQHGRQAVGIGVSEIDGHSITAMSFDEIL